MKKAAINYTKSIWFKVVNDQMSRNEAALLFMILLGVSLLVIEVI